MEERGIISPDTYDRKNNISYPVILMRSMSVHPIHRRLHLILRLETTNKSQLVSYYMCCSTNNQCIIYPTYLQLKFIKYQCILFGM